MGDYEIKTYRVVHYVEIGVSDGYGIGLWEGTLESVPFAKLEDAKALRDEWEASGKLERMSWGGLRPANSPYGIFRIRTEEEPLTKENPHD